MLWKKFKFNSYLSKPWAWLVIVGLINPILFGLNSRWFLITKNFPVSPIPLVFDAPRNIPYWSYDYYIEYTTEKGTIRKQLSHTIVGQIHSITLSSFYIMILGALVIHPDSPDNINYIKHIICNGTLQIYNLVTFEERIYKSKLIIENKAGQTLKEVEVLCN